MAAAGRRKDAKPVATELRQGFFAIPNHIRERGTNENTDELHLQYLRRCFCLHSVRQLQCLRITKN